MASDKYKDRKHSKDKHNDEDDNKLHRQDKEHRDKNNRSKDSCHNMEKEKKLNRDSREKDRDKYKEKEKDKERSRRNHSRSPYGRRDRSRSRDKKSRSRSYDRKTESRTRDRRSKSRDKRSRSRDRRSRSRERQTISRDRRSRSRDRRSRSRDRRSRSRDRRSRSRSHSRHGSHSRSSKYKHYDDRRYDSYSSRGKDIDYGPYKKTQRKMAILEKLGIDLIIPENMEKPQTAGQTQAAMLPAIQQTPVLSSQLAAYCNANPANSKMIMERLHRKKLLWQNKANPIEQMSSPDDSNKEASGSSKQPTSLWQTAIFSKDSDGKQTAKFKRLMGIKGDEGDAGKEATGSELIKKQEEMFQNMEAQYEVARASTHTHRGIGLGFGIHQYPR